MELSEIRPYVRYIHDFDLSCLFRPVIAYDHRIFYVAKGSMRIELGNETCSLSVTDLIYLPAGTPYRVFAENGEPVRAIGINFEFFLPPRAEAGILLPVAPAEFSPSRASECPRLSDTDSFDRILLLRRQPVGGERIEQMLSEYQDGRLWSREMTDTLLKQLLLELARREKAGDHRTSRLLEELMDYIKKNCHLPLANEDIGQALNFHPNYLNRLLVKNTGQTLHRFLISCRLSRAVTLLQNSDQGVAEIAEAVGFGDAQQFSKCFHRQMGVSPGNFRRNI